MSKKLGGLNSLVDAAKGRKLWIYDHMNVRAEDIRKGVLTLATDAMCFRGDHDDCDGLKILPELIKLPYPICYFEITVKGYVVGLLIGQGESGGKLSGFMFQQHETDFHWNLVTEFSMDADTYHLPTDIPDGSRTPAIKAIEWLAAYLSALNCINIKRIKHQPKPSEQSVRRALGRQPLFSYWTLEIDLIRGREICESMGGTHASPRLHLRRGHAREYAAGLWCWVHAHVVGDKSKGMVHKDYEVKNHE